MMNFRRLMSVLIVGICCIYGVHAQYGVISFDDGVAVVIRTKTTPEDKKDRSYGNIFSHNSGEDGNVIHRLMTDKKNRIYFGYDLVVEPAGEEGKFRVSIRPLSKEPRNLFSRTGSGANVTARTYISELDDYSLQALPNYPDPVVVGDGESITLELLENPETGAKISDVIKIRYKKDGVHYFSTGEGLDLTPQLVSTNRTPSA